MKYLVIIMAVTTAVLIGFDAGSLTPHVATTNHDAVQAVCDYSHNHDSGAWEEACGLAQDESHTKYLCNNGLTKCWVEDK